MSKEVEMISQQEVAQVLGLSKSTMTRKFQILAWKPTIDRRNNHAKCYSVKKIAEEFGIKQSIIMERVRKYRIECGHQPSRKMIPDYES